MILFLIILAILQGITEFLPISSSGHLALFQNIAIFADYSQKIGHSKLFTYDIMLHFATFLSILIFFYKDIWSILKGTVLFIKGDRTDDHKMAFHMAIWIVLANIPIAVIGILFKDQIESLFSSLIAVAVFFLINGLLLLSTWFLRDREIKVEPDNKISAKQAIIVGIMQSFAILPGISRSGSTITAGLWSGMAGKAAARFSFLLGLPAVGGAFLLELRKASKAAQGLQLNFEMILGMIVAFVVGLFALRILIWLMEKANIYSFGIYTFVLGLVILFLY